MGKGWTIWKCPADKYGLTGTPKEDTRSLAFGQFGINLGQMLFESYLRECEKVITGEERLLNRIRQFGRIPLHPGIGQALWNEPGHKSFEWLSEVLKVGWFEMQGATLRSPNDNRYPLAFYRNDNGWRWHYRWLNHGRRADILSASLASTLD